MEIGQPHLTDYQKEIILSPSRFTITEASTKAGKTHSHIIWLFAKSMEIEKADGKNYWWVAPVYSQAKIAYKRLKRNLILSGLFTFNDSGLYIKNPNGAEIHFKSAEKPDNLYGEDVYAAVFDEAPRARPESWYALRSTLSATEAPCKLIGNFGGISNWVHKLKEKSKKDINYAYFKVTCWDAIREGILSEKEVLQAKKDLPAKIFKELYEAESSEDEGQLIQNESIIKLFSNTHIEGGAYCVTGDVARLGNDLTVLILWNGLRVEQIKTMQISRTNDVVNAVNEWANKYNVNRSNIIIDEDGVGGGVVDYLRCIGFVNNSKPIKIKGKEQNFSNLKSQCYWELSEQINRNNIYIDTNSLEKENQELSIIEELEWVRLAKNIDINKISMLSKDEIKKHLGRSPDYSDALMMRMYLLINPNKGVYHVL